MSEQMHNDSHSASQSGGARWFSFLYRTRVKVNKEDVPILNLSLIFMLLAVCSAPWLAVTGLIIALALGYRFSIEKNANGFANNFQEVVNNAASNVKAAVDSVITVEKEHEE